MGQPITVVEKPSSNPAVLRFETNRPLTGMGHERYTSAPSEMLMKTGDELARRLFAAGGIETVHINGSVVTVTLSGGRTGAGLGDIVRSLFLHYGDQTAAPAEVPADDADITPEALADPAEAPAAQEAAEPAAAEPVVEDPPSDS
ncbi:MAG: NifU N-terminal domain-containing protein [Acidimicrobiales bacterium]